MQFEFLASFIYSILWCFLPKIEKGINSFKINYNNFDQSTRNDNLKILFGRLAGEFIVLGFSIRCSLQMCLSFKGPGHCFTS